MYWQSLNENKPDPKKILFLHVNGICYFAKAAILKDGQMIFAVSYTFKALLNIRNEMLPFFTLEQLCRRNAFWSLYTQPGETR